MKLVSTSWEASHEKPKVVKKLLSFNKNQIIQIQLQSGEEISDHQAGSDALIIVKKGQVKFSVEGREVVLTKNDLLYMEPEEVHSLIAIDDTEILLIKIPSSM